MSDTDRPLYEDLLKQRADLETLVKQMIGDLMNVAPTAADAYQGEYDRIVLENRRREGRT